VEQHSGVRVKKYRPDIDGLRAIAVVGVILFHLNYLRGGFVGVDVFFVISGFLITSILMTELEEGTFSLGGFYERRIRRIAPALFVVFAASVFLGYKYLLPGEFAQLANSLLAALLSVSNFVFWQQSGYFDTLSSSKPLLHTWSLAVEEQFYLLFPLLLALLFRIARKHIKLIILGIIAISLTLSILLTPRFANFAFYWPITRAWELLIGSLLVLVDVPLFRRSLLRNLAAGIGLATIIFALLRYTGNTPFPGIAALLPCLGAALIIAAGAHGKTIVGRTLSLKPIVFTGLISYSLYLWHWPIIVFAEHGMPLTGGLPHRLGKAVIFAVSFVVAAISWRFVERPFRRARAGSVRKKVFVTAGVAATLIAAVAIGVGFAGGFPSRFSLQAQRIAAYPELDASSLHKNWRVGTCFLSSSSTYKDFKSEVCLKRDALRETDLLMGDSHAAHLYYGLSQAFPEINFMQATASGCKPTLQSGLNDETECRSLVDWIFKSYLPSHPVAHVLLSGRWSAGDLDRLGDTVAYLKSVGVDPIVIGPMIEYDSALPTLLAISLRNHDPDLPAGHRLKSFRQLDETMSQLAANSWHALYISYYPYLCSRQDCTLLLPGDIPLQDDADHLSSSGSEYVAQKWRRAGVLPAKSFAPNLTGRRGSVREDCRAAGAASCA
jgi:peptidoglycan/LPS O-acetylase OafA/YrhL